MNQYERTKFVLDQHAGELTPVHRLLVEAVFNRLDRLIEQNDELLARGPTPRIYIAKTPEQASEISEQFIPFTDPLTEMSESLRGKPDETVYETKREPTDTERAK